jgi:hypothetical protein
MLLNVVLSRPSQALTSSTAGCLSGDSRDCIGLSEINLAGMFNYPCNLSNMGLIVVCSILPQAYP